MHRSKGSQVFTPVFHAVRRPFPTRATPPRAAGPHGPKGPGPDPARPRPCPVTQHGRGNCRERMPAEWRPDTKSNIDLFEACGNLVSGEHSGAATRRATRRALHQYGERSPGEGELLCPFGTACASRLCRGSDTMTQAASQAWAFYRDVAKSRTVWTVRDEGGFPAPKSAEGKRSQPFWSSLSRVQKIIKTVPAYAGFEPYEISWCEFCRKWVPRLINEGLLVGVNWSGKRARGYDRDPQRVQEAVEAMMERGQ